MYGDYSSYQKWNTSKNTYSTLTALTTNLDGAVSAKSANHQVFIQRMTLNIAVHAGQTITFQDSASVPVKFAAHTDFVGTPTQSPRSTVTLDFGPVGYALTAGKNLDVKQSGPGVVGTIRIEAYEKPVSGTLHTGLAASAQ